MFCSIVGCNKVKFCSDEIGSTFGKHFHRRKTRNSASLFGATSFSTTTLCRPTFRILCENAYQAGFAIIINILNRFGYPLDVSTCLWKKAVVFCSHLLFLNNIMSSYFTSYFCLAILLAIFV
jgi:hypothetical protein